MSCPEASTEPKVPAPVPFPGKGPSTTVPFPRKRHLGPGGHDRRVPTPVVITDPQDPRVADFRDLKAGDRPEGAPRWSGPVIVEGVPAVERLLASDYRIRAVFGVPGRVAALDLPDDVAA